MISRAAALAVVAWLAVLVLAGGAPAAAQQTPAAETLSRCVQTTGSLSVVVLMDESGSLRSTDPKNLRVEGLRAALAGLGRLADARLNGRRPRVEVLLVGFSGVVDPDPNAEDSRPNWQSVTGASVDALLADAGRFAQRNRGRSTDYKAALLASRQLLARRVGQITRDGGAAPCKALIWFTDGRYDIPGGPSAIADGTRFLCRDAGLMDGIASDDIVKFVVGLSLDPQGRGLLRSLADGSAPGCGSRLSPRTGVYYDVRNSAELFFVFGGLLDGDGDPLPPRPVCPVSTCDRGLASFTAVAGLRSFLIRAATGGDSITVALRGPAGDSLTLRPGESRASDVSGATIRQRWVSKRAVEIEADLPRTSSAWQGQWSLAFIDPSGKEPSAVPISRIQLFADVAPDLVGRPSVLRGAATRIPLQLVRSDGSPATTSPVADSARVSATITPSDTSSPTTLDVRPTGSFGAFTATAHLPGTSTAPFVYVDMQATFAPVAGISVTPERRSFKLATRLPAGQGYPEITPAELHPSSIEGAGSTTTTLVARASPDASGCVWIGQPRLSSSTPVTIDVVPSVRSGQSCLALKPGEVRQIRLRFSVDHGSSETARLDIPVGLRSSINRGDREVVVPSSFQLYPPPNVGKRILIIVALSVLGLLLPLLLLWLLNYGGARLAPPQLLRALAQDVLVTAGSDVQAAGGGAPVAGYRQFEPLSNEGTARRVRDQKVDVFDITAVPARRFRDLFSGPYALASSDRRPLVAGSTPALGQDKDETRRVVPLALAGTWLFLPREVHHPTEGDDGAATVEGRLAMIIADGGDIDDGARLLADASARLEAYDWSATVPATTPGPGARLRAALGRLRPRPREDPSHTSEDVVDSEGATPPLREEPEIGEDPHDY